MLVQASAISTLLIATAILSACSSRIVYEPKPIRATVNAININTATVEELEKLPYIGRKTAEAVVEFREQNGPFRKPEQLMQIRGVSEERFAELLPLIKTE
jgi:competence ComEA-like helix-hairpin-helix protein